jgi:hypothetical protein
MNEREENPQRDVPVEDLVNLINTLRLEVMELRDRYTKAPAPEQQQPLVQPQVPAFAAPDGPFGKEPKTADPKFFSHGAQDLNEFLLQLELLHTTQPSRFDNEAKKVGHAASFLRGAAGKWLTTYWAQPNKTFESFKKQLKKQFGNYNERSVATREMLRIKQGDRPVVQLASEFQRLYPLTDWNDSAVKWTFYQALNANIRSFLSLQLVDTDTFEDYVGKAITIDQHLRNEPGALGPLAPVRQDRPQVPPTQDDPMILDATRVRPPANQAQREERRRQGLCFRCGEHGHLARDCPRINRHQVYSVSPSLINNHLTVVLRLKQGVKVRALVDSGASLSFVDSSFAHKFGFQKFKETKDIVAETVDGRTLSCGVIKHYAEPSLKIGNVPFKAKLRMINSPHFPIILGTDWLKQMNPRIDWEKNEIEFPEQKTLVAGVGIVNEDDLSEEEKEKLKEKRKEEKEREVDNVIEMYYKDFMIVFSKEQAEKLPEHRPYDMTIELMGGKSPPFGPIYNLSEPERIELLRYIDENLKKGFIVPSKSPAGAPVLFVKKKDGSLRLCVDYRGLNEVTVKNRYPLPLISSLLDRLKGAQVFSKLDLHGAYNLVRVAKKDQWKTAFRTRYGHYEYRVMPFGLTNAPALFQSLMQDIFREYLDVFVVIYLDDILIFSKDEAEHKRHVKMVLQKLKEHGLYVKKSKCEFHVSKTTFLGVKISKDGIQMEESKVKAVLEWKPPSSTKGLQRFLGFSNYYRRFVQDYSKLILPLTALLKNDVKFEWSVDCQKAFDTLKEKFSTAPILMYPDQSKKFIVETDASDFALGAVLSQLDADGVTHPVAFHSRKLDKCEINYEIHDKELLAIKDAFEVWRHYLIGAQHQVEVITDHHNLEYFMTSKKLTRRQVRWSLFFADFDFVIKYRPGRSAVLPDALSRKEEYELTKEDKAVERQMFKPGVIVNAVRELDRKVSFEMFDLEDLKKELKEDELFKEKMNMELDPTKKWKIVDDLLYWGEKLYLPKGECREKVLKWFHDSKVGGHYGARKTIEMIRRQYLWVKMNQDIIDYVSSCDLCARTKVPRQLKQGLLQPLPIAEKSWNDLSVDFVVDLPKSRNCDSIMVVVDRRTKMSHFIGCNKTITAEGTAKLFIENVFRLHGLPKTVVSDRGPQFVAKFWKRLLQLLEMKPLLSTSFHPETDGQTERVNQVAEQYLRSFVNYRQNNWMDLLPFAEFSYNNTVHTGTKMSPFFANYAFHPRMSFDVPVEESSVPAAENLYSAMKEINEFLTNALKKSQETMKKNADLKRRHVEFKVGDKVLLRRSNIKTDRPSKKLDHNYLGPFEIIEKINDVAYRLRLPEKSRLHDVFHVSLLKSTKNLDVPAGPGPIAFDDDNSPIYTVEKICNSRYVQGKFQYLIHWKDYDESERTWEPASELYPSCSDLIRTFHEENPMKPRPRRGVMLGLGSNIGGLA